MDVDLYYNQVTGCISRDTWFNFWQGHKTVAYCRSFHLGCVASPADSFHGNEAARTWANPSSPCSAEFKNGWSYTSTLLFHFMACFLIRHRGILSFRVEGGGDGCWGREMQQTFQAAGSCEQLLQVLYHVLVTYKESLKFPSPLVDWSNWRKTGTVIFFSSENLVASSFKYRMHFLCLYLYFV